jgi:hypothetical protein
MEDHLPPKRKTGRERSHPMKKEERSENEKASSKGPQYQRSKKRKDRATQGTMSHTAVVAAKKRSPKRLPEQRLPEQRLPEQSLQLEKQQNPKPVMEPTPAEKVRWWRKFRGRTSGIVWLMHKRRHRWISAHGGLTHRGVCRRLNITADRRRNGERDNRFSRLLTHREMQLQRGLSR